MIEVEEEALSLSACAPLRRPLGKRCLRAFAGLQRVPAHQRRRAERVHRHAPGRLFLHQGRADGVLPAGPGDDGGAEDYATSGAHVAEYEATGKFIPAVIVKVGTMDDPGLRRAGHDHLHLRPRPTTTCPRASKRSSGFRARRAMAVSAIRALHKSRACRSICPMRLRTDIAQPWFLHQFGFDPIRGANRALVDLAAELIAVDLPSKVFGTRSHPGPARSQIWLGAPGKVGAVAQASTNTLNPL